MRGQAAGSPEPGSRRGRVVTVFSAKGGCGKTTLATNLAAVLADSGRSVALVDLDLAFGDVAIALQLFPTHSVADAVPLVETLDGAALGALLTAHRSGLQALMAPLEPGAADAVTTPLVARIIDLLRRPTSTTSSSTPLRRFDDQVLAAFDESDVIALMATLDIPALKNLKLTLETLELLNYPREPPQGGAEPRRLQGRADPGRGREDAAHAASAARSRPRATSLPAPTAASPIVRDDPKHPVSLAIRDFADDLRARHSTGRRRSRPRCGPTAGAACFAAGGR